MLTIIFNTNITEVKNRIPNTCGIVKKTDYNVKISDIEKNLLLLLIINLQILDKEIKDKWLFDESNNSNILKIFNLNTENKNSDSYSDIEKIKYWLFKHLILVISMAKIFLKMKHWKLDIISWVIGAGC